MDVLEQMYDVANRIAEYYGEFRSHVVAGREPSVRTYPDNSPPWARGGKPAAMRTTCRCRRCTGHGQPIYGGSSF